MIILKNLWPQKHNKCYEIQDYKVQLRESKCFPSEEMCSFYAVQNRDECLNKWTGVA